MDCVAQVHFALLNSICHIRYCKLVAHHAMLSDTLMLKALSLVHHRDRLSQIGLVLLCGEFQGNTMHE